MFDSKNRYITNGVQSNVPLYLIMILWELIDREKQNTQLDYLQIFRLSKENGKQRIVHEQEQPICVSYAGNIHRQDIRH